MKKIKIGVLGAYRGTSMINYCKRSDNAKVVAICDKSPDAIEAQKQHAEGLDITFYDNFEDFIKHDMDAVVLANYAHQHAPFAIRAMHEGKHVFSEVVPVQTLKEAVELIEAVEQTGMTYAYGENYCYMPCTAEMTRLYGENKIGELEYAECEYVHNGETIWPSITYGEKDHWRNWMYSTFYCTHSFGPIVHMSKLRPVSVIGIESNLNARRQRVGSRCANVGIEMVTLENGAIVKSIHGGLYRDAIWYSVHGSKGRMESGRPHSSDGTIEHIYVSADDYDGEYANRPVESYDPSRPLDKNAEGFGHGGSDFYSMYHFVEYLRGSKDGDIIDVYEAMDMFLPGMFAFRSILNGSVPTAIPNLRDPAERDKWRNDVACTDAAVAGDQLLPTRKGGTPDIEDAVYERQLQLWLKDKNSDSGYHAQATTQGSEPKA